VINNKLQLSPKVKEALHLGKPVLALESTIISHGMPYPQNLVVARELESIAEAKGVTPATICLMDGYIKVGLKDEELLRLATEKKVKKVSRRDISSVLINKETGATTVAATMVLAELGGIKVFATGGIGGVHRGAEINFDISADLPELSRTPVIVVSAGAKAILDLPKTLEYLETAGVPVLGYRTEIFPAFYSRNSDLIINRVNEPADIAEIYELNLSLGLKQGILVTNPIPEEDEIPFQEMASIIEKAVRELTINNITGQKVTPYLLGRIVELTDGRALQANIALVKNNVELGSEIARVVV
jgi:pseudouridylate synthase